MESMVWHQMRKPIPTWNRYTRCFPLNMRMERRTMNEEPRSLLTRTVNEVEHRNERYESCVVPHDEIFDWEDLADIEASIEVLQEGIEHDKQMRKHMTMRKEVDWNMKARTLWWESLNERNMGDKD